MRTYAKPLAFAPELKVRLSKSSDSATTSELSLRQKIMMVSVAVLSSFAVGSIPVVYAFTVAPTHSQTTTQTPMPQGEMF